MSSRYEWLQMLKWIFLLVSTQLVMIIYSKRFTSRAPLPLLLCLAQFAMSALLSAGVPCPQTQGVKWGLVRF